MKTFANGQRIKTAPGLPWLPAQLAGTIIHANCDGKTGCKVELDYPLKGRKTIFLLAKNMVPEG